MSIDIVKFKGKLEDERKLLEEELKSVGRKNPSNSKDWEAKPAEYEVITEDENELADSQEEFEANTAILKQLEIRYNEVLAALKRISEGTYGICEVSEEPIEEERLIANPAARTCTAHMG